MKKLALFKKTVKIKTKQLMRYNKDREKQMAKMDVKLYHNN